MSMICFPALILSIIVIYFACRRYRSPALIFIIINSLGFLACALMSNIIFSIVLGESSIILTDNRSIIGGGVSWTVLVFTTIVILQRPSKEADDLTITPDIGRDTNYSTARVLKTLIGPGLLSVGIASLCASIVDLFIFFMYGAIGLDFETITEPLIWLAGLFYVVVCVGTSFFIFVMLTKRINKTDTLEKAPSTQASSSTSPIKLWTPGTIGFCTFFFGFPSGVLLSSINWIRMGLNKKALYHLVAGLAGTFAIVTILLIIPGNRGRGISGLINIGMAFYLNSQIKKDIEVFISNNREIQNAHWFGGCLISLLMVGFYFFLAFIVVMVFIFLGIPIPE